MPTTYADTRGREWTIRPVPFWGFVAELSEADGGHIRAYAPEQDDLVRALDLVPAGGRVTVNGPRVPRNPPASGPKSA